MDLLPVVLTSFATTMATKGADGPAQTLNNLWKYVFGGLDNTLLSKIAERDQIYREQYANSIIEKISEIPDDHIQEPKRSILGPGLEASKFYIDEKVLRDLFANLLASSFDSRKNKQIHHSFIEIIKQLSPLDAENLKIIFNAHSPVPIANYLIENSQTGKSSHFKNYIFLSNPQNLNIDEQAASIINLKRLGLIETDFTKWLSDDNHYTRLNENNLVEELNREWAVRKEQVQIEKGIVLISSLGFNFCSICLD